eukprot:c26008_g1_i1 orf=310-870(+)
MTTISRYLLLIFAMAAIAMVVMNTQQVEAKKGPKKVEFFLYISVQNNSQLNAPNVTYTAVQSGQPPTPQNNSFGIIHTFDSPITSAASLNSTLLGRAQGFYGDVGQDVLTLLLVVTFTYDDGKHNGTFSVLGADIANAPSNKFVPVVGGTGDFSFARGVAQLGLVSIANINHETVSWFSYVVTFKY